MANEFLVLGGVGETRGTKGRIEMDNGVVVKVQEKDLHFIIAQRFKCMWGNHLSWFYERPCGSSQADFVYLSTYSGTKGLHLFEVKMPYDKDCARTEKQIADYLKVANYVHFIGVDHNPEIDKEYVSLWRFDSSTLEIKGIPGRTMKRQNHMRTQERHIFILSLLNDLYDRIKWSQRMLPDEWRITQVGEMQVKIERELRDLYVTCLSQ